MINFKKTQLLGHRGARVEALENTLFGFQHAKRLQARGLAGVELDVQLTADGHLIVFHDDTLQRLCGLQARIDQLSLREIQRHTQSGHHIITLDMLAQSLPLSMSAPAFRPQRQALNSLLGINTISSDKAYEITELSSQAHTLSQFTHIELEIKTHNRTDHTKLVQALLRYLVNSPLSSLPLVLTSFDKTLLAQLQQHPQLSSISRGLLVLEPSLISSAPNTALRLGCNQLGIHYPLLNEQTIANCHRYQLPVSAWTVNDISAIKQLIEWQVDVIITDIPSQLL
ncbi:glycerophosphodiester phosphodiesterase [uncultured Psychrobacter sp.]|uniref:glycerophosphodiester phosphodiesterase n=1 Tax=uncultured Psychrobacter sp. TaxID=259303 RepID=UPI00262E8B71|nr:glycerophosphodiester phosphodiesterase [uncultured Psychrobacter sp.]